MMQGKLRESSCFVSAGRRASCPRGDVLHVRRAKHVVSVSSCGQLYSWFDQPTSSQHSVSYYKLNPRCEKMSGMQRLRSSIQFDSVYPTRISNQREIRRAPSSKNARLPNRQTTSPTDFTRLGLSPDGDGGRFWVGCTADSGKIAFLFSRRCARTCGLIVCTVRPRDRSTIKSSAVRPSVYRRQRESLVPQPKAPLCRALRFVCGYAFCCPLAENSLPSRLGSGVNLARTAPKKVKQACL
ncbi:hypothetical protein HDK90DRAFT_173718 [Phyllosticta capitalensis]|uniref:Uncharacterized protein n=1 Tax=Phyllosticta capitalensis TaxID=121624 RepID=A0ABR1YVA0_9PEZI